MAALEALAPSLNLAIALHGVGAVLTIMEALGKSRTMRVEHANHGLFL